MCAVFTAFSTVFIYISAVFPTGQLALSAVAGLFVIAAVCEYGARAGILVYVCSGILSFIVVPDISAVWIYIAFFGIYPLVKLIAERVKSRVAGFLLKICFFNLSLSLLLFLFSVTVFDMTILGNSYFVLFPFATVVFIVFDVGLNQVIAFYLNRISNKIRKN